jgi:hypothetical protein
MIIMMEQPNINIFLGMKEEEEDESIPFITTGIAVHTSSIILRIVGIVILLISIIEIIPIRLVCRLTNRRKNEKCQYNKYRSEEFLCTENQINS